MHDAHIGGVECPLRERTSGIIPFRVRAIPFGVDGNLSLGETACTGTAASAGRPELEGASTPAPHIDRTAEVLLLRTRWVPACACVPVDGIHLPDTDIIGSSPRVPVHRIGIAARFMRHDALALALVPTTETRAGSSDVDTHGGRAARAARAAARRAVALQSTKPTAERNGKREGHVTAAA